METKDIVLTTVNICAIVFSPVIAVLIGQHLQNKTRKREDKMMIFKTLMADRHYGWTTRDSVYVLNIIEIVFSDSNKVREKWASYHEYMSGSAENINMQSINTKRTELLEAIAENLGYKGKVTWKTVQNSYMPNGFSDYLTKEARLQEGQVKFMNFIGNFINKFSIESMSTQDIIKSIGSDIGNTIIEAIKGFFSSFENLEENKDEQSTTGTNVDREKREDKPRNPNTD